MLGPGIEASGTALWESGTRTEASRSSRNGRGARNDTRRAGTRISPFLTLAPQHGGRGRRSARRLIPQRLGVGRCPFRGTEPMPSASTGRRVSPYRRRHQSRRQVLCSFRCYASGLLNGVVVTALNPTLADRLRVPGSRGEVSIMVLPAPLARMPATRGLRGGWDEPFGTRRAAELVPTVSAIGAKHVSIHWSLGLSFYS